MVTNISGRYYNHWNKLALGTRGLGLAREAVSDVPLPVEKQCSSGLAESNRKNPQINMRLMREIWESQALSK